MITIAGEAMVEALRLGISSFAFETDFKDAGIDSPTAPVGEYSVKGAFDAYRTQLFLNSKHTTDFAPLKKVTLLPGGAFFTEAGEGIKQAIAGYKN
jgi:hypothetical protein